MSRESCFITILVIALLTGACSRYSVAVPSTETDSASIGGPVIFVSINGVIPDEKPKHHDIPAGENEVTILFRSYMQTSECTYIFNAVAGHQYEFVTRANPDPITLYRVARENWLFSTRWTWVNPSAT